MGWKGNMRTVFAIMRAAERDSQRRHKQNLKEQMADDAAEAVEDWKDHIRSLISIHTDLTDAIDWHSILKVSEPKKPIISKVHREKVAAKIRSFKPRFYDGILGGVQKRKKKLIASFEKASELDKSSDRLAAEKYLKEMNEWKADTSMARKLIAGDSGAMKEVVSEMQSLSGEGLVGTKIEFKFGVGLVHVFPEVHTDEVIPNFRRKQLASGRLSETKMPVGEFNELYQDYVASVALKVAGDMFQILPLPEVYVTCNSVLLNSATGYQEPTPILSVKFVRETFMRLRLDGIDPSDALDNFVHVTNFKRMKGFSRITPMQEI